MKTRHSKYIFHLLTQKSERNLNDQDVFLHACIYVFQQAT